MTSVETHEYVTTREKILRYLLVNRTPDGSNCTIKDIATELNLSTNATRQYMVVLEKDGLVTRMEKKGATGRPAMTYALLDKAFEAFPKVYKDFSLDLISIIKAKYGLEETADILNIAGKKIANDIINMISEKLDDGVSFHSLTTKERLDKVAEIYQEYGKFPDLIEEEDSFLMKNYNCLIYGIAKADPLVCKVDETMISELAGKKAIKEKCIRDGDDCCLYRIRKT